MNFTKTASIIGLLLLMMSCGKVADKEFGDPIVLDLAKDPVDMKLSDFVERVSHIYLGPAEKLSDKAHQKPA